MTIQATPDPTAGAVLVNLAGVAAGTTVTRDAGRGPETVRGMRDLAAGDHALSDREAPFGVQLRYGTTTDTDTATATLDVRLPWLSHPLLPLALPVTVENDSPVDWETPGQVHVPVDGGDVTATYVPRRVVRGNLRIPVRDADLSTVAQLFADGSPLLLRTPPGCPVSDRWVWADTVTRDRPIADGSIGWVDVPYTRVSAPAVPEAPETPWTWEQVPLVYATWDTVTAATWLELLAGPAAATGGNGWSW